MCSIRPPDEHSSIPCFAAGHSCDASGTTWNALFGLANEQFSSCYSDYINSSNTPRWGPPFLIASLSLLQFRTCPKRFSQRKCLRFSQRKSGVYKVLYDFPKLFVQKIALCYEKRAKYICGYCCSHAIERFSLRFAIE